MTPEEIIAIRNKYKNKQQMKVAIDSVANNLADEFIKQGYKSEKVIIRKPIVIRSNGMKNSLTDLNNYLFEQLERLMDDEVCSDDEKTKMELAKTETICKVANTIIHNADVQLSAMKFRKENEMLKTEMPQMLLEK